MTTYHLKELLFFPEQPVLNTFKIILLWRV
jgi:hypothetical protein